MGMFANVLGGESKVCNSAKLRVTRDERMTFVAIVPKGFSFLALLCGTN